MLRRVVITGIGVVSPFGYGLDILEQGLESRASAVKSLACWADLIGLKSLVGAPVEIMNEKSIPRSYRRSMSKMSILAVQAADMAIEMAHLQREELKDGRTGCIIGSTTGSPEAMEQAFGKIFVNKSIAELTSMSFFKGMSHTATANVAQYLGLSGLVTASCSACASSLQAIALGADLIRLGRQDKLFCGGAEELHPTTIASFDILEATSIRYNGEPQKTPRPFDSAREGLVCGEGAGILILEEYEAAKKRGAPIFAEIVGSGMNTSNVPMTQSDAEALSDCMQLALSEANLIPEDIDYINAHATGTIHGDAAEAKAIHSLFGKNVPVSSLKGYIGHTLGASGAIESAAALLMMRNNVIYPCLNLDSIAADCSMINIPLIKTHKKIIHTIKNAFAFGGINTSVVFRKIQE